MESAFICICDIPELTSEEWTTLYVSLGTDVCPGFVESFLSIGGGPGYQMAVALQSRIGDSDDISNCKFVALKGVFGQPYGDSFYRLDLMEYQLLTEDDYLAVMISSQNELTFKHY